MPEQKDEKLNSEDADNKTKNYCIDFHGAAIVSKNGNEVAITEEMIEEACDKLQDEQTMTPYLKN
jgi:hypothetical protein